MFKTFKVFCFVFMRENWGGVAQAIFQCERLLIVLVMLLCVCQRF